MISIIISTMIISLAVILIALLIFGFILCKKHGFKAGYYFFSIFIFLQIFQIIFPLMLNSYIDHLIASKTKPLGMTIGEIVSLYPLLPTIIELIAFSFLVIGLYQMWNTKRNHSVDENMS